MSQNKTFKVGSYKRKSSKTYIKQQPDKLDLDNQQFINKSNPINWNDILLHDIQYILELFKQSPMNYSFTDINAFISDIKDYVHPNLSYYEYQYLLRIFIHKVHDDHTKLNFNDFTCMYAGFTAVFEVNPNIAIFRNKHISTIDKKSDSIKFRATNQDGSMKPLKVKYIDSIEESLQEFKIKVDMINSKYLLDQIKQGDEIVLINKESALQYLKRVGQYSQRNTCSQYYIIMKQTLQLGIMNYMFPVSSITIIRQGKLYKIKLQYETINKNLQFPVDNVNYPLERYIKAKLGRVPIYKDVQLIKINKQLILITLPNFRSDIKVLEQIQLQLEEIFNYKESAKSTINTIIIDIRSNPGGSAEFLYQFIYMLLRNRISFIASKVGISSISKEFTKEKFDSKSADVLNSDISTKSKQKKLKQLSTIYKKIIKLTTQYLKQLTFDTKDVDIQEIIDKQANMYLGHQIPGIVLITNDICISSCSILVSTLQIFPHVIIVGSDTQGFNGSATVKSWNLPSNIGKLSIPTYNMIFDLSKQYLQQSQANLYLHSQNIPRKIEQLCNWLQRNKSYFDSLILNQCTKYK